MAEESTKEIHLSQGKQGDPNEVRTLLIERSSQIYRYVIFVLGIIVILVILVIGALLWKSGEATIPDGLIAIGSAAVGAIAGLLAQSPSTQANQGQ